MIFVHVIMSCGTLSTGLRIIHACCTCVRVAQSSAVIDGKAGANIYSGLGRKFNQLRFQVAYVDLAFLELALEVIINLLPLRHRLNTL